MQDKEIKPNRFGYVPGDVVYVFHAAPRFARHERDTVEVCEFVRDLSDGGFSLVTRDGKKRRITKGGRLYGGNTYTEAVAPKAKQEERAATVRMISARFKVAQRVEAKLGDAALKMTALRHHGHTSELRAILMDAIALIDGFDQEVAVVRVKGAIEDAGGVPA